MTSSRRTFIKQVGAVSLLAALPQDFAQASDLKYALTRKTPESQGVSSTGIRNFLVAIKESGLEWHSFMLVRHGNVVAEGWWKPFDAHYKHTLYSLSKSFTSTAIGFLVDEGKITVDDKVISFFPEDLPVSVSDNLKAMKIKHLLTMNTGHDVDTMPKLREMINQSWVKTFLEQPVLHEPSTHFLYNTGATYMLGAIVHKVTGQNLEKYLAPRLFEPLGIEGYDWETSPQGLNTAGFGLRVKTEDIAKFGQFYLQKGKWNGKQLLPESWIEEATKKQTSSNKGDSDWSQGYGYQFWRCKPGFYRGDGAFGQFCMVMPEQDAVLVMTSESWDLQKTMNVAYQTLLPAMSNTALAENADELDSLKNDIKILSLATPKGASTSSLANQYMNKVFQAETNSYGIKDLSFYFDKDYCLLKLTSSKGVDKIKFGWQNWLVNDSPARNLFQVPNRTHMPSKIAGTAVWINDNTLQLNEKFVEAIHGDKLSCVFDGNKVTIAFINSVSENTKNSPEKRDNLVGVIRI
ncbi:serine hydrolase [Emticicia sp. BO119]|uniref:serine hydrolase domain-containing protein n=1 Tax=Emticicia sp. BO119 TaxID=2757768 RepID=UPI0015F0C7E0|nr:serine hydrolase [Emticicia sp. BO119]MBA4849995.1 serine hydrolase [Emticicia sp. BO119]